MSRRNSQKSPTSLVVSRGKSCGKVGYFMTSIVPGLDPKRGFFPVAGRANALASVSFRSAHFERVASVNL